MEISALMDNWLFLQAAPNSFKPSTAKLQSSKLGFSASSATQTSSWSSSRDQELAWATHWRVAVMKASGLKSPEIFHYNDNDQLHLLLLDRDGSQSLPESEDRDGSDPRHDRPPGSPQSQRIPWRR